jgi:hypothetical protein
MRERWRTILAGNVFNRRKEMLMNRLHAIAFSSLLAFGLLGCEQGAAPSKPGMPSAPGDPPKSIQPSRPSSNSTALPSSSLSSMPQRFPDDVVRSNVKTALAAVPGLENSSIDVSVSQGVVTLNGKVSGADQRAEVLQYVSRVQGVQTVVDQLKVG